MRKEDEKLLQRVTQEQDKHGLVLDENVDEGDFHKVIQRLIEEPPVPKQKRVRRLKRGASKAPKR
jgi:hypothetical protein